MSVEEKNQPAEASPFEHANDGTVHIDSAIAMGIARNVDDFMVSLLDFGLLRQS